jgi:hypothetical protein
VDSSLSCVVRSLQAAVPKGRKSLAWAARSFSTPTAPTSQPSLDKDPANPGCSLASKFACCAFSPHADGPDPAPGGFQVPAKYASPSQDHGLGMGATTSDFPSSEPAETAQGARSCSLGWAITQVRMTEAGAGSIRARHPPSSMPCGSTAASPPQHSTSFPALSNAALACSIPRQHAQYEQPPGVTSAHHPCKPLPFLQHPLVAHIMASLLRRPASRANGAPTRAPQLATNCCWWCVPLCRHGHGRNLQMPWRRCISPPPPPALQP